MDFSERIDQLEQRVQAAKEGVRAAAVESRERVQRRIDQAHTDAHDAVRTAEHQAQQVAADAQSSWTRLKTELSTKAAEARTRLDERGRQLDAKAAAHDADRAEQEAAAGLDLALWAVVNAEAAVLEAIDARLRADEFAATAAV